MEKDSTKRTCPVSDLNGSYLRSKKEQLYLIRYGRPDPALPAAVEVVGHSYPSSSYHVAKQKHSTSMFEYILSGKGYILYQDKRYAVNVGDMIFMRQGVSVNYGADSGHPYEKLWVTCRGPMIDMFADFFFSDAEVYICHGAGADILQKLEKAAKEQPDETYFLHLLADLFLQMKRCRSGKPVDTESSG